MKKLRELVLERRSLEGHILIVDNNREIEKENFKKAETELNRKRDLKISEAKDFRHKMDIATGFSTLQHNLILKYLRLDEKLKNEVHEAVEKLKALDDEIRERGKKLSKKVHISHGMMAEALTEYFENYDDGTAWKVMRVHPYLFNNQRGCFEHRFGTYIVSDESSSFAGEEIYTLNDPENEFPKAITIGFGRGSKTDVQIAQEKLDRINWLDIYLQGLVGGMDIPKNLTVFKSVGELDWDRIDDVFECVILENAKYELDDEEQNC